MSEEERKLKAKVDEYFEKYMCVSFNKFIENWEDLERYSKEQDKILQQKENIIKEVREYIEKYELVSGYNKNENYSNCNVKEYLLEILKGE